MELLAILILRMYRRDLPILNLDAGHTRAHMNRPAFVLNALCTRFPKLARAEAWILELVYERLDLVGLLSTEDGAAHNLSQVQSLNTLRSPIRSDLRTGAAPHFF